MLMFYTFLKSILNTNAPAKMVVWIFLLSTVCKIVDGITLPYDTIYILNYIKDRNFPVEVHDVRTEDGYILNLHRIPHGNNNSSDKGVVLLAHGLEESAEHWVINDNKSLAFLLPNLGYDVWMTNARGSHHSKDHIKYNMNDPKYWDFSWHEIGIYDLPVTIDYILSHTGASNMSYIGHSQGVTSFLVMTSLKSEYNDKINIMIGLAPAVYMYNIRNPLYRVLSNIWEMIYPYRGLLDNALINVVIGHLCKNTILIQSVCANMLFSLSGYDYDQLDAAIMPEISRSLPAGSSTKQLIHYLQLVKSGYFRQYDYRASENRQRYNRSTPPNYDLKKVTTKIALYYSRNDWLADPEDVGRLRSELINAEIVVDHLMKFEHFNHFDFLFAKEVVPLLYNHVIETLNKYN